MILCCGEALIDCLPRKTADGAVAYQPFAGGSVYNTAIALGRLGAPVALFTGLSTDFFGQLTSFFVPNVTWRGTNQSADGKLLHVFAHIHSNEGVLAIKQVAGQGPGKFCFTYACWAEENKGANRFFRILQSNTITLD